MSIFKISMAVILFGALSVPLISNAQDAGASDPYLFKRNGVFGCPLDGGISSVGANAATQSAYVPVNDAAVTINTYTLVYKECVLRGVLLRQREAATAALQRGGILNYMTARDGNPQFSQILPKERTEVRDLAYLQGTQNGTLNTLNTEFKGVVSRAVVNGYVTSRNASNKNFACSYAGVKSALNGRPQGSYWEALKALQNPACNPYGATKLVDEQFVRNSESEVNDMMVRLGWGNGNYGVEKIDADGNRVTLTPGAIVAGNVTQLLQTGYRQLENANDIDQMVSSLFAGITSHVIGDARGLLGLTQSAGGQPSYLDQVSRDAAQGVRNAAVNAALTVLSGAKQIESALKQVFDTMAGVISNTIGTLRARENACWALIIDRVCTAAPGANNTCQSKSSCTTDPEGVETCSSSVTLKVATSTAFSQAVINAQIAGIASSTIFELEKTNNAVTLIDRLIANVTNTASVEAQRVALQQLDGLVANGQLHSRYDLDAAQKRSQDVTSLMAQLITDTTAAWADSQDPNVGWCNINNAAVIQRWENAWK